MLAAVVSQSAVGLLVRFECHVEQIPERFESPSEPDFDVPKDANHATTACVVVEMAANSKFVPSHGLVDFNFLQSLRSISALLLLLRRHVAILIPAPDI